MKARSKPTLQACVPICKDGSARLQIFRRLFGTNVVLCRYEEIMVTSEWLKYTAVYTLRDACGHTQNADQKNLDTTYA
jgi:hypothetical protein